LSVDDATDTFSPMALIIRDPETEQLAAEVGFLMGESETGAVQLALREAFVRHVGEAERPWRRPGDLTRFLEAEIWPQIPDHLRGRPPMTRAEREEILGIGPEGY
jgi:hypothetical protein